MAARTRRALSSGARGGDSGRASPEELLDLRQALPDPDVAGHRDDEVLRRVPGAVVAVQVGQADASDRLGAPQDRRAQGMAPPEGADEHLVDEVVGIVVSLAELFQDHAPLDLDVHGVERGRQDQVAHQVERLGKPGVERVDVEARVLLRREGVHVAAEPVDLPGDPNRRPAAGALEEDVLQEVGDPLPRRRLVTRPGPDEESQGKRTHVLHPIDQDSGAVLEDKFLDHLRAPGRRGYSIPGVPWAGRVTL